MTVKGGIERLGPEEARADFRHKGKRYRHLFRGPGAVREAKLWMQAIRRPEILEALGIMAQGPDPGPVLADVMDSYLRRMEAKGKPAETLRNVRASFARISAFFPPLTLAMRVTGADVADYWDFRLRTPEKGRQTRGSAVLHDLLYLRAAYRRAGLEPPWKTPKDLKETIPDPTRRVLGDAQMRALLAAMPAESSERAFGEFLARTGMRPGDARGLTWDRLDMEAGTVTVRTSKRGRTIRLRLSPKALEALRAWYRSPERIPSMGGHVFTWRGRPLGAETLRQRLARACDAAGIPRTGWGTFRHTALGAAYAGGADVRDLQAAAGHRSIATTEHYIGQFPALSEALIDIDSRY